VIISYAKCTDYSEDILSVTVVLGKKRNARTGTWLVLPEQ
jgi:hypothetical protein